MGYKIWNPHLCWIAPDAQIGDGTTIGNFTEVGFGVKIGKNCKIQAFVFIPKGVTLEDNVFIGPATTFTNDRYPTAKAYGKFEQTTVQEGANIGAGSTIRCGITIGKGATIGAGSVVTRDVPAFSTVKGVAAK
jgi:acetyltransferase-like isoleucine patch superfamily enzyme